MKEEIVVKIKADASPLKSTMNQLRNEASNFNKLINGSASSSSSITTNTTASAKAAGKLSQALNGVKNQLQNMSSTDIFDIAGSLLGLEAVKTAVKGIKNTMNDVKALKLFDAAEGWMGKNQPSKGSGFLMGDAGLMKARNDVSLLQNEIEKFLTEGGTSKELEVISAKLKKLGVSTKGTTSGFKGLAAAVKSVGVAMSAALVALGALLVLLPVFAIGVSAALKVSKLGDEVYHTAQRFGMSTDKFQEWSYIMEKNGGTIEDLTGFMETLASEQAAVIEGSEDAAKTFERLGLSMEEVSGMRQQELFEEVVKRIQNIGDATERSAIAYSLFGDEASKFMNVLNMTNAEMDKVIENYYLLGGAMSGDLINKSNSLQSSISNMKQAWQGISNTLAEVFIPVVQAVVNWLTKAFVTINLFLRSLFGLDLKTKGAGGSMDGATSSTNKYSNAAKSATKAAKELRRVTMGFDELNILNNPSSDSSTSGSSSPDMGGSMGGLDTSILDASSLNLEGLYAWFEKYKTLIRDIVAWSMLIIGVVGGVIMLCMGNFIAAGALLAMAGIGLAVGSGEGGTWDKFLSDHKGIADALGKIWTVFKDVLVGTFVTIWEAVKLCGVIIYEAFLGAWEIIKAVWDTVAQFFKTIWTTIEGIFAVVEHVLAGDFKAAWEAIKKVFSSWGTFFSTLWNSLKQIFSAVGTFLGNAFSAAWKAIKNVFAGWGDFFTGLWNTIKKLFGNIAQSIGNSIVSIVKGAINGIFSMIENKVNFFVDALNAAIGVINKIPGVDITKLTRLKIPRLAEGGIATSSTIANVGEAGKEAILPLENNTEWMDTLASKIAERNSAPSKIVLQVGEKELGWATINGINNITKQTGNIQLVL